MFLRASFFFPDSLLPAFFRRLRDSNKLRSGGAVSGRGEETAERTGGVNDTDDA